MTTFPRPDDAPSRVAGRDYRAWIGGQPVATASAGHRSTYDPSTGQPVVEVPWSGADEADTAVDAAAAAQPGWAALDVFARGEVLARAADRIERHAEEFAELDAVDAGNPVAAMRTDLAIAVRNLRRTIGIAPTLAGRVLTGRPGGLHYTTHRPYGVVVKIVPFNHPSLFAIGALGPILLGGNTLVLKPAEQTPLSALRLGELLADVLPAGVFNVVAGGREVGDALVRDRRVKRIAFTGSVPVAQAIQRAAAEAGVKHVSAELGGKNPMIVYPDVDVEQVADAVITGMNLTVCQGQSCGSTSRILAHRDVHDPLVEAIAERHRALRVGPAYADGTDVGPLVSDTRRDRVLGLVGTAEREGARLVIGGRAPRDPEGGYFVEPALLTDVRHGTTIATEEVFGPVTSVLSWRDPDEAVRIANDLDLALTASVWTGSLDDALTTVGALHAGYVWVNETAVHVWGLPFGGMKDSGLGREEDLSEIESFMETQAVVMRTRP